MRPSSRSASASRSRPTLGDVDHDRARAPSPHLGERPVGGAWRMSHSATFIPTCAKARAIPSPIPDAPVTMAVLPADLHRVLLDDRHLVYTIATPRHDVARSVPKPGRSA
jgi:hypothetical protein